MRNLPLTLRVITDSAGAVLATQQIIADVDIADYSRLVPENHSRAGDSVPARAYRRIVPRPDQFEYTVDVEVPERVLDAMDVDALHELVRAETDRLRATTE